MPALALLKHWKLILAGLLIAALVIGWLMLKAAWAEKDAAEQREKAALVALETAVAVNEQNLAEMARWRAEAERASQAVVEAERLSAARATQLRAIRQEIVADASQSCPVAPVVSRTLDGLRVLRGTPDRDEDPGRAGGASDKPADVPE